MFFGDGTCGEMAGDMFMVTCFEGAAGSGFALSQVVRKMRCHKLLGAHKLVVGRDWMGGNV